MENLSNEDYLCEQAFSFREAMGRIWSYEYDCILLDLMLPGGSGLDLLRDIKNTSPATGVIIVSAKDSLNDKVNGLKFGKTVRVNNQPVQHTKTEYDISLFLIENKGLVVSKNSLAEHISGDIAGMMDDFDFVYAPIKNLKAKLARFSTTDCIKTCYGVGYKCNPDI